MSPPQRGLGSPSARDRRDRGPQARTERSGRRSGAAAERAGSRSPSGRPAASLDRLVHERTRLGIVATLAANPGLSFSDLKRTLGVTDGNLSAHARKLEEAGYIACEKGFDGRMPRTRYHLTGTGRRALDRYLAHMEGLIRAARPRGR